MNDELPASPLRVLVLDFDGVVLESNDVKTEAFVAVFSRFPEHRDAMMAYHQGHVSETRFAKFDHLLTRLGRDGDRALRDELASDFSRRVLEMVGDVPFVAGAKALLDEFSLRLPLYLASVTPQDDLDATVEQRGLRRYFRATYGCPPWTKAGAIRDCLRRESCPASAAALIGDSPGDQRAAAEAGVEFIARDSGLRFATSPASPFPDLSAIADFLRPRLP